MRRHAEILRRRPILTFQAGEFDLVFSSKLSDHLSFLAEVVLGPDNTNEFGPDIERYTLTYRVNRYFSAAAQGGSTPRIGLLQHRLSSRELVFHGRGTADHVLVRG